VVLVARSAKELEQVEEEIFQAGGSATIAPVDLTEPEGIARLATAISSRWSALDILVINAATLPTLTPVWQIDPREFNLAMTLNVMATQALIAGFDAMLKRSGNARVIGVTSSVGAKPAPTGAPMAPPRPRSTTCWNPTRRKSGRSRTSASPCSIQAPRARRCALAPIRAKTPIR
jgi:NAD(P)-dependent dehydrogenase (short-subunit alcohol dehydrogenase family)